MEQHWGVPPSPRTKGFGGQAPSRIPDLIIRSVGESPSGKAAAFEAAIRWFESILPSHALLAALECMAAPNFVAQILCMS
jgi:hypothetical protein